MSPTITIADTPADRFAADELRTLYADPGDRQLYGVDHELEWNPSRYVLIARENTADNAKAIAEGTPAGAAVGAATAWHIGGVAKITDLLVAPNARRKGVARSLVAEFTRRASQGGCHRLHAVTVSGSGAEAFWRAQGWTVAARLPDHYFHREHVVMSKALR